MPYAKKSCQDNSIEYKLLLLLDNAPAHPSVEMLQSKDGRDNTMLLPPNTISIIQPMDQGILEAMKRRYKKSVFYVISFLIMTRRH